MAKKKDMNSDGGLYKIQISSSGSYSIKSEDIFPDKDTSLATLNALRKIVGRYKETVKPSTIEKSDKSKSRK